MTKVLYLRATKEEIESIRQLGVDAPDDICKSAVSGVYGALPVLKSESMMNKGLIPRFIRKSWANHLYKEARIHENDGDLEPLKKRVEG